MSDPRRRDRGWLAGLLAVVLAFLLPALRQTAPTCYCDAPVESVPRVFAIARTVQSGELPLWDGATFAGARPFYITNESAPFYPPLYPFYAWAPLDDIASASFWLVLLPYALHLLWGAAGAFAFARLTLGVPPSAAAVAGLLWALSPEMAVQIHTPDVAYLFGHLPWVLLALQRFVRHGTVRWWLAATGAIGLLVAVGTLNFTLRALFVAAVTAFSIWLGYHRRGGMRRLAAAAATFVVGIGLNGFALAGVVEGLGWLQQQVGPLTTQQAGDLLAESSMPPSYVATLFVPTFFGVLDSSHTWGVALEEGVTNLSALSGGMALVTAMLAGLILALRRGPCSPREARWRWWARFALVVQVLALLTMMGRYTPVFDVLCTALPWFFRIPHAVYYRFAQCWSALLLAAIGITALARGDVRPRWRLVGLCITLALISFAYPLFQPKPDESEYIAAYKQLFDLREGAWFARGPLAYFLGAAAGLSVLFLVVPRRWRAPGLALAIAAESIGFGIPIFYESLLFETQRSGPRQVIEVQDRRYRSVAEHPHAAIGAAAVARAGASGSRFVGFNSRVDNQAWLHGGRALLGYSSKPLEPRFADVVEELTRGQPYDLMWHEPPSATSPASTFLRHMNVGFVVGRLDASPEWMHQAEGLAIHVLPEPLPRWYVQENIVAADASTQRRQLLHGDLRRAAYVDAGSGVPARDDQAEVRAATAGEIAAFASMQERHAVRLEDTDGNRQRIAIEAKGPVFLVRNEVWHPGWSATLDGAPAELLRVNYLQQGVLVPPGRHTLELRFFPTSLAWGAAVSCLSALVVAVVGLARILPQNTAPRRNAATP